YNWVLDGSNVIIGNSLFKNTCYNTTVDLDMRVALRSIVIGSFSFENYVGVHRLYGAISIGNYNFQNLKKGTGGGTVANPNFIAIGSNIFKTLSDNPSGDFGANN